MNELRSRRSFALFAIAARWIVALVFGFAAYPKLLDPVMFARDIDNYRMLPDAWIGPLAIGLPPLEVVVTLALVTGIHARGAAVVTAGMLGAFIVGMVQAIARGIDLDCGCFGHFVEAQVSWWTVARNATLIALLIPTWLVRTATPPDAATPPPPT